MLAVFEDVHAIDKHVLHTDRILMRLLVGGAVGDGRRIEDDHVGEVPFLQRPAAVKAEIRGRQVREFANGGFESQQLFVADKSAEHAGEMLRSAHLGRVLVRIVPHMGHELPPDFDRTVGRAVAWLVH